MPALGEEQENQKRTDAALWPLLSRDLALMAERTNRRKRGRTGELFEEITAEKFPSLIQTV